MSNEKPRSTLQPLSQAELRDINGGSNAAAVIAEVKADVQKIENAVKAFVNAL